MKPSMMIFSHTVEDYLRGSIWPKTIKNTQMKYLFFFASFFILKTVAAQKKPLDHSVYDSWQSIGQKLISNDGRWVVYTINPQEGDNELVIQSTASDTSYKKTIAR